MVVRLVPVLLCVCMLSVAQAAAPSATKRAVVASVDQHAAELAGLSDKIWGYAETALKEHKSSALLADYAEQQGFTVTRGVSGMPTAFVARFGSGKPVIGIMGEYDALPGVSQQAIAQKSPLVEGAAGHGCGHNMFGPASLGAALAIKEQIAAGKLKGTIVFYGTPAEEAVGGKTYMARDGVFDEVDVMFAWHPGDETMADAVTSQAMVDVIVEFKGQAAHAASDPWNGRSALDGALAFANGVEMMREHMKTSSRVHYVIPDGGDVPNVIPEHAKVWIWARDQKRSEVDDLYARIRKIAEGAALMTGTQAVVTLNGGSWEMLLNDTGAKLLDANLRWIGAPTYTAAEQDFAKQIQAATHVPTVGMDSGIRSLKDQEPQGGSTDVGDVSWVVPTLTITVVTAPKAAPWHAWPVVATGGMSIGHKGLVVASKTLAATMVDLYADPAKVRDVRAEFERRRGDVQFKAYLPDGPPQLPKD
ncbi:MAG TPA: amidohydrolase [Steroidobacteraceae bacterium]|nr:amidohydrolase [Steroidobacteraceae bacterium]